jgi:thymidine kinase
VSTNIMVGGSEAYEPRCVKCFQPLSTPPPPEES